MPSLSRAQKEALRQSTKGAAMALVEDLAYLRETLAITDPAAASVRHISAIMRRLTVERDLTKVANPRMDRPMFLLCPDNHPIIEAEGSVPYRAFVSGGAQAFGVSVRACLVETGPVARPLPGFHPDKRIPMRLDGFLHQRVLCMNGEWANRHDVIKYVAIIASGVHSEPPKIPVEQLLTRIRSAVRFRKEQHPSLGEIAAINANVAAINLPGSIDFDYASDKLDPVLIELLSAADFIVNSPHVQELERIVREGG
jgi:hypothetical protein